ncbi:hypothetical protein ACFYVL_40005 [Streptomyces sp. NPDC004111]|uniref:hypothetical protein n=1 Tax=Streptomyces sp. NPDC004111 TaxID=3364690 RepID=UPI0036AEC3E9
MSITVPNPVKPSVDELWDAPLPELYERLNVELVESPIADPKFFGAVMVRREGGIILMLAPGLTEFETDCFARSLLSDAVGGVLPPLSGSFETTSRPLGNADPDIEEALRRVRERDAR